MNTPLQISFHNLPHSREAENTVKEYVRRLEGIYDRIVSCRVVLDQPHRHHREGNLFQVRIDLKVPGAELVTKRELDGSFAYSDLSTVVHEAFDEIKQQLEQFIDRRRGFVKTHDGLPRGRVSRLFLEAGYGFLETADGREVFFHRHSVLPGGFDSLSIGTEVSFVEELGEKGPQASSVKLVGRHSHLS
jgi:cold shock CspA family protein